MPGSLLQDILGSPREILDKITIVDAKKTPLLSGISKGDTFAKTNMHLEWPVDAEEEPGENAVPDGKDVENFDRADDSYAIIENRGQWSRRAGMIGKLAEKVQAQAGIPNKKAYAITKKLMQLKRDIEIRIAGDGTATVGTKIAGNKSRGMGDFLTATAQTVYPVPEAFRTPAASIYSGALSAMTEDSIQALGESIYNQCGTKKDMALVCGTAIKKAFTKFGQTQLSTDNVMSTVRVINQDAASRKLVNTVDRWDGDFFNLELIPTVWNAYLDANGAKQATVTSKRGYIIDWDRWAIRWAQMPDAEDLPYGGGGEKFMVDAIWTLIGLNPLDQGAIKAS